jgi:hypothetical protein
MSTSRLLAPLAFALLTACGGASNSPQPDGPPETDAAEQTDAAAEPDGGIASDTAPPSDAVAERDATSAPDAEAPDTRPEADAEAPAEDVSDDDAEDTADVNPCQALGGLCLGGDAAACTDGGGKRVPAGDAGCVFDDGPGVCCAPPEPKETGDTCRDHGGLCAPIAGCNFTQGNFAPPSCWQQGGPGTVCCVPQPICGPETNFCCDANTTFRPMCDRGDFTCSAFPGTEYKPRDACP